MVEVDEQAPMDQPCPLLQKDQTVAVCALYVCVYDKVVSLQSQSGIIFMMHLRWKLIIWRLIFKSTPQSALKLLCHQTRYYSLLYFQCCNVRALVNILVSKTNINTHSNALTLLSKISFSLLTSSMAFSQSCISMSDASFPQRVFMKLGSFAGI